MKPELEITTDARQIKAEAECPACGGSGLEVFFEIPELPVNCIALYATREAALNCPKAGIDLGFCRRCGAVSNLLFDSARLTYDFGYDNSLHFSPVFQNYSDELARDLVARYNLRNKNIIDVGCGSGEFLSLLCALGNNHGVGFDSAFITGPRQSGGRKRYYYYPGLLLRAVCRTRGRFRYLSPRARAYRRAAALSVQREGGPCAKSRRGYIF